NQSLSDEVAERRVSEVARVRLLAQLVTAQEDERRRLARDLHDQLGQQLTGLRLKLETLKNQNAKRAGLKVSIEELLEMITRLDADIDFLAWELRPFVLDDLGLVAALRNYVAQWCERFNVSGEFHSSGLETRRLSPEVENHLYRIAQEALNNIAKHSDASRVDVLLERRDGNVVFIVEDNGIGFEGPSAASEDTMGLTTMRERALLIDGSMEIESKRGKGTTIFVRVPITTLLESQKKTR
ncbi:MAG TPA: sensor histidine kinase, partial [Pyrinomonadaceae bacterium]|nr:sensor histidine kinase [Pyrinomonadaceae bacterium]